MAWRTVGADQAREHLNHVAGPDAARYLDSQAFARPLIDYGQALELLAVSAAVEDEVICPDVIGGRRW